MAKSIYANAAITEDHTFEGLIEKLNLMMRDMAVSVVTVGNTTVANSDNGLLTTGNGSINGIFSANSFVAVSELRGGDIATSNTLNITSEVLFSNNVTSNNDSITITTNTFTLSGNSATLDVETITANVTTITLVSSNADLTFTDLTVTVGNTSTITTDSLTIDTDTLSLSSIVNTSISSNGTLSITGNNITIETTNNTTFASEVVFSSNVAIFGEITTPISILGIREAILILNYDAANSVPTENVSIQIERGGANNAAITWLEGDDSWSFSHDLRIENNLEVNGIVTITQDLIVNGNTTFSGNVNIVGELTTNTLILENPATVSLTGDATGSALFDGSSNVEIVANVVSDSHTHTLSTITDAGTAAAYDVGTAANNVVQLDALGRLPSIDGSLLINLPGANAAVQSVNGKNGVVILGIDDIAGNLEFSDIIGDLESTRINWEYETVDAANTVEIALDFANSTQFDVTVEEDLLIDVIGLTALNRQIGYLTIHNPNGKNISFTNNVRYNTLVFSEITNEYSASLNEANTVPLGGSASGDKSFTITDNGTRLYIGNEFGDIVYQYTLSTPWDITSNSALVSQKDFGSFTLRAFRFNDVGSKIYVLDQDSRTIRQHPLTSNWTASSANTTSNANVVISSYESQPQAIEFNNDGTKLFFVGRSSSDIHWLTLSTPFDLATATYTSNTDISAELGSSNDNLTGITFNRSGTKMWINNDNNPTGLYDYTLSTPFDVTTRGAPTQLNVTPFHITGKYSDGGDIQFGGFSDNPQLFITGRNGDVLGSIVLPKQPADVIQLMQISNTEVVATKLYSYDLDAD